MTPLRGRFVLSFALAFFCLGLPALFGRAPIDNTVQSLLAADDAVSAEYRSFLQSFGTDEIVVVRVDGPEVHRVLSETASVAALLAKDPIVAQVLGPRELFPDVTDTLLDPTIADLVDRSAIERTLGGPLNQTLPILRTDPPSGSVVGLARVSPPEDRARLLRALERWRTQLPSGMTAAIAGPPLLNLRLDREGRRVEMTALPILAAVTLLVLMAILRSAAQTAALLLPVGFALAATSGALSAAGGSRNVIVDVASPLIFVLLVATGLHVVVAHRRHLAAGAAGRIASWAAAREKRRPCLWALGTTAAGFGSLSLSSVPPIRTFGILTAGGLLLGIPLLLIVLPSLLEMAPGSARTSASRRLESLAEWTVESAAARPGIWIAFGVLLVFAGLNAFPRLDVEPHAIRYFPKDDPLRRDAQRIDREGLGTATIELVLTATESWANRGGALRRIDQTLKSALRNEPAVRAHIGPTLFLQEAAHRQGAPGEWVDALTVKNVLGRPEVSAFLDETQHRLRTSILIADMDAGELRALRKKIQRALAPMLEPDAVSITGNYELLLTAQERLVQTLLRSLVLTALLMELAFLLAFRSARLALIALLPNGIPVAANFGFMAALGMPIDLGTSMTAAIALGIAVDDSLHLVTAWQTGSLSHCARETGQAVIVSSLVIALGFSALMSSSFLPVQRFGLLIAMAMVWALVSDLTVLPALLEKFGQNARPRE